MTDVGDADSASPCLVLDIGGTKVEAAIVSADGSLVRHERVNVAEHTPDLFDALVTLARRVLGDHEVKVVGVGCAGPMTRGGGTVSPLNIPSWREFPLRQSLRDALGLDAFVNGDAGHVGHLTVVANGALCSCGAYRCLKAEASGWAIEARTGRPAREADQATRLRTGELVGRAVGMLSSVLDFRHGYVAGSVPSATVTITLPGQRRPRATRQSCPTRTTSRYCRRNSAGTDRSSVRRSWDGEV